MAEEKPRFLLDEEKEFKRTYQWSLWWVEHRGALKQFGYGVFMFVDALLLVFVFWTFLDTYAISFDRERTAVEQMVVQSVSDLRAYTLSRAATDLVQEDARVFSIGEHRYDFYAMLTNENLDWWVEFDYVYQYNETSTPKQHAIFLPGEHKPVVQLGITSSDSVRSTELLITDLKWHRIDHHDIGDYATWFAERSRIVISDLAFSRESNTKNPIGVSTFTLENKTAFSFLNPTFIVLLKQGSSVVGVNQVTLTSLESLEKKSVSLNWFGTIPGVTTIEVIPDINVLDSTVYQRARGVLQGDARVRNE